jgi:threonine aldolase
MRNAPRAHGPAPRIDLYSDTMTRPTEAMRLYMSAAPVGDEQKGEDPTVNELQDRVAALLGKETAVFLPSGTMCNEIALMVHCRPGDAYFCDRTAHPLHAEAGGPGALAGVQGHVIDGERGIYAPEQLETAIGNQSRYTPRASLAWVEQTANLGGGTCWSLDRIREVAGVARAHGLATHMDGARLMNAVIRTGVSAAAFAAPFDSVWLDFSKGLGAPVGAVLAGSEEFIDQAWRLKQRLGGSMRQAGIIAAGAVYALDHNIERLGEDHANAARLAKALAAMPHVELDPASVETNIIVMGLRDWPGGTAAFVDRLLEEQGVRGSLVGSGRVRFVTHLDVTPSDIDAAIEAIATVLGGGD